jgi:hypothetical protein
VGGATPVLRRGALVGGALVAALVLYYLLRDELPDIDEDLDAVVVALILIPVVFALVWLALPLREWRGVLPVGLAFAAAAAVCELADLDTMANFAKLGAATLIAFWFLTFFESLGWVVLVAAMIPIVDSYSVFAGPTEHIVEEEPEVFTLLSFFFPLPGETGGANLGIPDLLFFALFLAAAARFGLRVGWTWLCLTLSFGASLLLTIAFDVEGVPALPLLSLGFLLPNADLIWRELRAAWARRKAAKEDEPG